MSAALICRDPRWISCGTVSEFAPSVPQHRRTTPTAAPIRPCPRSWYFARQTRIAPAIASTAVVATKAPSSRNQRGTTQVCRASGHTMDTGICRVAARLLDDRRMRSDYLAQLNDAVRDSAIVLDNGEVLWPFDAAGDAIDELARLGRVTSASMPANATTFDWPPRCRSAISSRRRTPWTSNAVGSKPTRP